MKFEINDNTGMIKIRHDHDPHSTGVIITVDGIRTGDLEAILQAVKKTQTKQVNKQVQEIQDSKNRRNIKIDICEDGKPHIWKPAHEKSRITTGPLSEGPIQRYNFCTKCEIGDLGTTYLNLEEIERNQKIVNFFIRVVTEKLVDIPEAYGLERGIPEGSKGIPYQTNTIQFDEGFQTVTENEQRNIGDILYRLTGKDAKDI